MWYCYIIECIGIGKWNQNKIQYYTGETTDIERRWHEHLAGHNSYWMKRNRWRPRRFVYIECLPSCTSKDVAMIREKQIKRLSHDKKRSMIN